MRLPQSVQQIADVIGREQALSLIRQLPRAYTRGHPSGQPILYVPKSVSLTHPLVTMIGYAAAEKLARAFGGEILYPAACISIERAARNEEIGRLLRKGVSCIEIARLFGLTDRHVKNIGQEIAPEVFGESRAQHCTQLQLTFQAAA